MKEISEEKITEILQGNSENLNLEFKDTFDFNTVWPREKLIRAILAMSNTRDGGLIVIGVKEKGRIPTYSGINEQHLSKFKENIENLKAKVESFSSSPTAYEIFVGTKAGVNFIIISVTEFSKNPVVCRRDGDSDNEKILEEGAIYIRTLKDKPSSIKLSNPVDVEDFLERAVDKQIKRLHSRGWKHDTENKVLPNTKLFESERNDF